MGSKASLKGKTNIFIAELDVVGITRHETVVPILRVSALAFLYLLGKAEAEGLSGKS